MVVVGIGAPLSELEALWATPAVQNNDLAKTNLAARILATMAHPELVAKAQQRGGTFTLVDYDFKTGGAGDFLAGLNTTADRYQGRGPAPLVAPVVPLGSSTAQPAAFPVVPVALGAVALGLAWWLS